MAANPSAASWSSYEAARTLMKSGKLDHDLIRACVEQGLTDAEIADKFGWTIGTLRVRCSQQKISLRRRRKSGHRRAQCHFTMKFALPEPLLERLVQRALSMQVSTSELVADLLATIDRDDLYGAVLDRGDLTSVTNSANGTRHVKLVSDRMAA
jgi:hypothetical protein